MNKRKLLMLCLAACTIPLHAQAIEENDYAPIELDQEEDTLFHAGAKKDYIYTLDNYAEHSKTMGINIDTVTRRDIERQNSPMLKDILQQSGSVFVNTTNGSDGNVSTLRIRGTDRVRATLDGIRIDRASSANSTPELQNIISDDLESVEIIKGPQGNVLGTNALGGAVNMTTRRGEGKFKLETGSVMGNYGTFKERAAIMGGNEKADYYLSATYNKTDGSMRSKEYGRFYNDGYRNFNIVSNLGLRLLGNKAELRNVFRTSNSRKKLGLGYGSAFDPVTWETRNYFYNEPNSYSRNVDVTDSLTFKHAVNDRYDYLVRLGVMHNRYGFYDPSDVLNFDPGYRDKSKMKSTRFNAMTQHNIKLADWNKLSVGYNFENEHINMNDLNWSTPSPWGGGMDGYKAKGSTIQNDVYLNDLISFKDMLFIRGGARLSSNNKYGTYVLPNASAALVLPTFKLNGAKTKFRSSWGQSVNNPTLYQRYAAIPSYMLVPNPNLDAEKIQSWDVGIEQSFFDDKLKLEFGYFDSKYKDYIGYYNGWNVFPAENSYYYNIDKAKLHGYEGKLSFEPNDKLKLVFNYTYTDSKNSATLKALDGVPNNMLNGVIYYSPFERLDLYAGVQNSSSMYSGSRDVKAKGGTDVRIGTSIRLFSIGNVHFYLKANILNLLNQKISYYRTNYDEIYCPKIRYNLGLYIEYNPDKEIKKREKKKKKDAEEDV